MLDFLFPTSGPEEDLCVHEVQPLPPSASVSKDCRVGQQVGPPRAECRGEPELCLLCPPNSCLASLSFVTFLCPHEIPMGPFFSLPTLSSSRPFVVSSLLQQISSPTSVIRPALKPTRPFLPGWLLHLRELDWTPGLGSPAVSSPRLPRSPGRPGVQARLPQGGPCPALPDPQ